MAAKELEKEVVKKRGRPKGSKNKEKKPEKREELPEMQTEAVEGEKKPKREVTKPRVRRKSAASSSSDEDSKTKTGAGVASEEKKVASESEVSEMTAEVRENKQKTAARRGRKPVSAASVSPAASVPSAVSDHPAAGNNSVSASAEASSGSASEEPLLSLQYPSSERERREDRLQAEKINKKNGRRKRKKPTTTYVKSLVGMIPVDADDTGVSAATGKVAPDVAERRDVSDFGRREKEEEAAGAEKHPCADALGAPSAQEAPNAVSSGASEEAEGESAAEETPREISGLKVEGVFEISEQQGSSYGFLRQNGISTENDIYVSPMFTKKFNLKNGEYVRGVAKSEQTDKYRPLLYVRDVNGVPPYMNRSKYKFDDMTPQFPRDRFHLSKDSSDIAMRIIDLIAPVGKGQRGLIVAPPKSGKTILLQKIAKAIRHNYPEVELMILLIDERPEEVTDMKDEVAAPVYYSTFDELPINHIRIAELVLNRARGLVEMGKDVVILLDSITRLARAYNIAMPASGRTLSGGLDTSALHKPKRFLGSARNMIEGGSLTIMATALIETGSKMDDVIFEEFKGTGNMELILDRKLSEKRIFPSIDIKRSGTRREELLLNREEYEAILKLRRALDQNGGNEPVELLSEELMKTRNNEELIRWINNVFTEKPYRK